MYTGPLHAARVSARKLTSTKRIYFALRFWQALRYWACGTSNSTRLMNLYSYRIYDGLYVLGKHIHVHYNITSSVAFSEIFCLGIGRKISFVFVVEVKDASTWLDLQSFHVAAWRGMGEKLPAYVFLL